MLHSLAHTKLFQPIQVGQVSLEHRVVHAPTSRARSTSDFVASDLMLDYYLLRSSNPGTLVVFESTLVSPLAGLTPHKPGVFTVQQKCALRAIFDGIHKNGSYVSVQLVAPGRVASAALLKKFGVPLVAPSEVYFSEDLKKRAELENVVLQLLTIDQIHQIQQDLVDAAVACVNECGADFVEIHGTSGFLVEQFLSPLSNTRTDHYGGSVENRARFLFELLDKFLDAVGPAKVGLRLAPFSTQNGMVYPEHEDIREHPGLQFCEYVVRELETRKQDGNEIAYLSLVEPRVSGNADVREQPQSQTNASVLKLWSGIVIRSGAYATNYAAEIESNVVRVHDGAHMHYEQLIQDVEADDRTLIGLSRPFTSNPDLIDRLRNGLELSVYDRPHFYTHAVRGYLTFGKYDEELIVPDEELERVGTPLGIQ